MNRSILTKGIVTLLICILFTAAATATVSAAPDEVSSSDGGNSYDLVVITNPPEYASNTFDRSYIVQGHAAEGVKITLYWHDASADVYRKIYNHINYYDAYGNLNTQYEEAAVNVGSSNLFMKNIELSYGGNNIMVYAEKDGMYQILKFNVTLYNYNNIFDIIRSITS